MRVQIGDIALYFDTVGAQLAPVGPHMVERPTLLLLHGGPGFDHSYFRPLFDTFASEAQIVLIDHRGQGRSDRSTPNKWNLDTWGDDIGRVCRALDIRKPILLGSSFGGFVALAAAARDPDLASGVILLGSAARISIPRVVERFGELGGDAARDAAKGLFEAPDDPVVVERFMQTCLPLYARAGVPPDFASRSIATPDVLAHFFRPGGEYANYDLRSSLGGLRIPILMLHGARDPIVPVEFARETAAAFHAGTADLHIFADCAHDVPSDAWDEAEPLIRKFLRERTAGRS